MWETRKKTPGFNVINVLSDLFDKSMDYILDPPDDDRSVKPTEADQSQIRARLEHGRWRVTVVKS